MARQSSSSFIHSIIAGTVTALATKEETLLILATINKPLLVLLWWATSRCQPHKKCQKLQTEPMVKTQQRADRPDCGKS